MRKFALPEQSQSEIIVLRDLLTHVVPHFHSLNILLQPHPRTAAPEWMNLPKPRPW